MMFLKLYQTVFIAILLLLSFHSFALEYPLPSNGDDVVGDVYIVQSQPGETLGSIGRQYDIGYYEMVEANPLLHPDQPLHPGSFVMIPSRFILPNAPHKGVVVNLAELRLYYYPPGKHEVITYPVGIGRQGWTTPLGTTKIRAKVKDPVWYVPKSIREFRAKQGVQLPLTVPAGPNNPLGKYALPLEFPHIVIHSTNKPDGVGRRASSGCIRMLPADIKDLFPMVNVGTQVTIVNQAYKVGWRHDQLFLEAHVPLQEQQAIDHGSLAPMTDAISAAAQHRYAAINWKNANEVATTKDGIPQIIGIAAPAPAHLAG